MTEATQEGVRVFGINRELRLALTETGVLGRFVGYIDEDGEDCEDLESAVVVIVEWETGGFSPLTLSDYPIGGRTCH